MTTQDVPAPVDRDEKSPSEESERRGVDAHVWDKIGGIQPLYLRRDTRGLAALAQLRRAINAEVGDDPAVWSLTLEGLPAYLRGTGDAPSTAERAVHTAMTLYAVHQQSQRDPMNRRGHSLGDASRDLSRREGVSDEAVRRRFVMLSTASSWDEVVHHARGLITQFRATGLPLDYGRLAADLDALQDPQRAPGVRLRWGRAYHRRPREDASDD